MPAKGKDPSQRDQDERGSESRADGVSLEEQPKALAFER